MPQNYVRTFCGGLYFQSKLVPCRGHVITCFKGWLIVQKEHVKQGYQDENRRNSEIFSHTLPYNRWNALLLCDKKKIYNFKYHFHKPFSLSFFLSLYSLTHSYNLFSSTCLSIKNCKVGLRLFITFLTIIVAFIISYSFYRINSKNTK